MIYDNEEYNEDQTDKDTKSIVYTLFGLLLAVLFIGIVIGYLIKLLFK